MNSMTSTIPRIASLPVLLVGLTFFILLILPTLACAATDPCTGTGSGAGECSEPHGLATDFQTERLYVADRGNDRIDVFEANGTFLYAFGYGVDTGAEELQTCTAASTCQAGIPGSKAGQLNNPTRIAVDNHSAGTPPRHRVYVVTGDYRWQAFEPDGTFLSATGWGVENGTSELQTCTIGSGCLAGIKGAGECQLSDSTFNRVDPIAIGPAGDVFLAETAGSEPNFTDKVERFTPAGVCVEETQITTGGNNRLRGLAIDSEGDAWLSIEAGNGRLLASGVYHYELGTPEAQLCQDVQVAGEGLELGSEAIALDDEGHLFAGQREKNRGVIATYDSACHVIRRFGYGHIQQGLFGYLRGLAALPSGGGLFASEKDTSKVRLLQIPPGPVVLSESLEAKPLSAAWAQIGAEVNPEGVPTTIRIEYLDKASFETEGGWLSPKVKSTGSVPLGSEDFSVHPAQTTAGCHPYSAQAKTEGKCLTPDTEYVFRVIAESTDGEGEAEGHFTTLPAPTLVATYATEVGTTSARLDAVANPNGVPTEARFQYVVEQSFQESEWAAATLLPAEAAASISFGSGEAALTRSALATGLREGTTYRFRLLAEGPFGLTTGPTAALRTFRAPAAAPCANDAYRIAAAGLPDCRAYELVSPLDKEGGDVVLAGGTSQPTASGPVLNQAAVSGEKLAYGSYRAFVDAPNAPWIAEYVAARGPGGWQSHSIDPEQATGASIGRIVEFAKETWALSPDLCQSWLTPHNEPKLTEDAIAGYKNIYRRSDPLCGPQSYEALTTAAPVTIAAPQSIEGKEYGLELQGLAADGTVAVFAAPGQLQGAGGPAQPACLANGNGCTFQLYAKASGGAVRFLCVLPGGTLSTAPCAAGTGWGNIPIVGDPLGDAGRLLTAQNAVSADGSRVFWTSSITSGDGRIYARENPLATGAECKTAASRCTVDVSKRGEEESGTTKSHFWAAAEDGSTAIYTTGKTGQSDLYEYDLEAPSEAAGTKRIARGVGGLVGASEDARRIYFTTTEVLSGAGVQTERCQADLLGEEVCRQALAGEPNLYFHEAGAGTYRFLGTLGSEDGFAGNRPNNGSTAVASEPSAHNGRVSPDGRSAAFMASTSLTGYDSTDAASREEDEQVYLYDAVSDTLRCVSCNPSGARPAGENLGSAFPFPVAARIPTWTTSLYPGRVLADDGSRLYFESMDPLSPRDTNGKLDVYQWQAPETGTCSAESATYSTLNGGCVDLISSGRSDRDSELIDASPDGHDVFFATSQSLLPRDPGQVDIYDARVQGGFPEPPPRPAACEGEACQPAAQAPQDPTPASAHFYGAGNVREEGAKAKRCGKGKVRCVKKHAKRHKKHRKHRRHAKRGRR